MCTTFSRKEIFPQFTRPGGLIDKNPCRNATLLSINITFWHVPIIYNAAILPSSKHLKGCSKLCVCVKHYLRCVSIWNIWKFFSGAFESVKYGKILTQSRRIKDVELSFHWFLEAKASLDSNCAFNVQGVFFSSLVPPLNVPSTKKLILARIGVSRLIYVNVDSPNLGQEIGWG